MSEDLADLKPQVYKDPRPAEHFTRFHERSRTRDPDWVYDAVRMLLVPTNLIVFRAWAIGAENVPGSGPVLLAPNHFSNMDHFFLAGFLRRRVRFMAKSQLFTGPLEWIFLHGGVFPVRRGHRDEEAFITADAILDRGACVAMYAEGGRSRSGKLGERVRPGVGRIALTSGAPVVPTAIQGSARVRNWRRGNFPRVTIQYGEPIRFARVERPTKDEQQAAAERIFADVRRLYEGLERHGRRGAAKLARAARRDRERTAA